MAIFPLERATHSWLVVNASHTLHNASFFPAPPPTLGQDTPGLPDASLTLFLQNMSLGALSFLAMQEAASRNSSAFSPTSLLILVSVLKTVAGLALLVVSLPLVLPLLLVFWAVSFLARLSYVLNFGSSVRKAEGMDSIWGVEFSESRPFITVCLLVRGIPDVYSVQRHVLAKVLEVRDSTGGYKHRKFRQVFSQQCGYYCWRDDPHFHVTNHVREVSLRHLYPGRCGPQGETVRSEEMDDLVRRFVSEEGTTPLPPHRPPWELLLLTRDDGRYNVVMRLHHAIGDGVSLVRLCVEALVDTPLPPPPVGPPPPNPFVRAAMMVWSMAVLPLGLLQVVANFDHNSLHGPPLSGRKMMTWSRGMPLSLLRQVKTAASATVNDVLMTCLSSALAKLFTRRQETVGLVTMVVPVSFHDLRSPLTLTNRFSVATLKLPVPPALPPPARLSATKRVLDAMKRDPTLWAVFWVVRAVGAVLPAHVLSRLLSGTGVTLAASNVPGPQQEISIWGDPVEDLVFWVPNRVPVGLGVSFISYKGVVKVGLNVDLALIHSRQEAQQLVQDMEEELSRLHHLLASRH